MAASDEDKYVRSETLPAWMVKTGSTVVPIALLAALGTGFTSWQSLAVLANRVERLESFADRGDRFTASDGRAVTARLDQLETWQRNHIQFGYEYVGQQNEKFADIYRRLKHLEEHVEESK